MERAPVVSSDGSIVGTNGAAGVSQAPLFRTIGAAVEKSDPATRHVQVIGELQTREYIAKDGTMKSVTEIRVQRVARLDRAPKTESTTTDEQAGAAA